MAGYQDRSDPGEPAFTSWIMAGLSASGAFWLGWQLGWPWVLSHDDPHFDPVLIPEAALLGLTVSFPVKGAVWQRRAQDHGATYRELDGPVPVPLGGSLAPA